MRAVRPQFRRYRYRYYERCAGGAAIRFRRAAIGSVAVTRIPLHTSTRYLRYTHVWPVGCTRAAPSTLRSTLNVPIGRTGTIVTIETNSAG